MRPTLAAVALLLCACPNPSLPADAGLTDAGVFDAGVDAGPGGPPGFARFCQGHDFAASLTPYTLGALDGGYVGFYANGVNAAGMQVPMPVGAQEMMKVIPPAPFLVDKIRVAFAKGSGTARLRLETTFGRSYPSSFQSHDPDEPNPLDFPYYVASDDDVVPPVEITVTDAGSDEWIEIDVSDAGATLLPTQHYMIVYEHETAEPYLAIESVAAGDYSRALLLFPDQSGAYGVSGSDNNAANYRLELVGRTFCSWSEPERWFADGSPVTTAVGLAEIADVDSDGHDDLVLGIDGHPRVYGGDGAGHFTPSAFDGLALADQASMLAFADFDNDGDQDVLATLYVYPDQDGDGSTVPADCNDHNAAIHPGATEVMGNGVDDDCDGHADDGTSSTDADSDGFTIAQGDCDDTNPAVHPGAVELLDGLDNNCDGRADEGFHHVMLLNPGDGHFVAKASPTIELSEPASEIALGDANGDGKLDVYWGDWLIHYPDAPAGPSHFVEGNGDGTFVDAMRDAGMIIPVNKPVYGVTFNDFNNDGLQDIYVGNYQLNDNLLWQNHGTGQFTNVAATLRVAHDDFPSPYPQYPGGHSYGSDFGDLDNDGDMDFWVSNLSHPRTQPWADPSMLYFNNGAPTFDFVDKRHDWGVVYDEGDINGYFGDFDNDMDLDLVVGSLYTGHYNKLYRNDGDHFTDVTYEANVAVHQGQNVAWADFNEDGALDLMVHGSDAPQLHVFTNRIGTKNNWVELKLQGTTSNRDAVGARVTLVAGGVSQIRDVKGTCGGGISAGLCSRTVHFGLAKNPTIDSVSVRWVQGATANSGPSEVVTGVQPNGIYRVVQGSGAASKLK